MANTTVSKVTISKDNASALVTSVRDGLKVINKGYLSIAGDVAKLYETKAYEVLGYENFDKLCENEFEMSHGTTVGIRKVFNLYGTRSSKDGSYIIPEKYSKFGYTKLLMFATQKNDFEKANINPIDEFTPDMTIGEMKAHLKGVLADKATKQDENAIETTATDVDENETANENENANENESANVNENETAKEAKELSTIELIDTLLTDNDNLHVMMKDYIKPEKEVMFDAIASYLKELKKIAKEHDKKASK